MDERSGDSCPAGLRALSTVASRPVRVAVAARAPGNGRWRKLPGLMVSLIIVAAFVAAGWTVVPRGDPIGGVRYYQAPAERLRLSPTGTMPVFVMRHDQSAIRHGVAPETSVSEIEIAATREGDRLYLSVRDNGPGVHAEPKRGNGGGLGIANTRARLLELYGPSHRFELTNAPDSEGGGALATIEIPYSDHARDYR